MKKQGHKVEAVKLETRRLVTIAPTSAMWQLTPTGWDWSELDAEGAIFRLQPPAGTSPEQVDQMKRWLLDKGAAVVRPDAAALSAKLPEAEQASRPHASQREVVMQLAEASARAEELEQLLDVELAKAKL